MDPQDAIVAVFGLNADRAETFLGTGSIVGDGSILLTADHVTRDCPGPFAIYHLGDLSAPYNITLIERDPLHDLALYRIAGYRPARPLQLAFDEAVGSNSELMTFEYGTTRMENGQINLSPATRMGHMTRFLNATERLGPAGVAALELSFPALRGASGAPVMFQETAARILMGQESFGIVGVIVANASYHLLPAQIESVIDVENNYAEEIRFMLPQALAVNIHHLRPMYERATAES